jgi:4-carboxymuconolactone decarboxylase
VGMRTLSTAIVLSLSAACAHSQRAPVVGERRSAPAAPTREDILAVSPALGRFTNDIVQGDLWKREGLSLRDRRIVTLATLISRGDVGALQSTLELALDHGVKPAEVSEIIAHLAFYSGWGRVMSSVPIARRVFDTRGVRPEQLPAAAGGLLPIDETAEAKRATQVEANFGSIAPGVVQYTTELVFRDLWLRPGIAPRDRSLVTVSALIATGQGAQLPFHLNKAMDLGLTRAQVGEVLTTAAFYAGWPSVFSVLPIVKEVVEKRPTEPTR